MFIEMQSTANLEAKVPTLFSGLSKNAAGILNNFLRVSSLTLKVNFSPTVVKKYYCNVHKKISAKYK